MACLARVAEADRRRSAVQYRTDATVDKHPDAPVSSRSLHRHFNTSEPQINESGILDGLCDIKGPSNAASIGGNGAFSSHTCDIGNIQSLFRPLLTSERLTGT